MCAPLNPDCENCPLAGDCLAYAEATLVSEGKPVEYDMEDLGGCSPVLSYGTLTADICGLCPPFEIEHMDRSKWISSHYPKKVIKKAPQEQSTP